MRLTVNKTVPISIVDIFIIFINILGNIWDM